MEYYVCIDIGGTAIKYGLVNRNGEFIDKASMPTEADLGGIGIVAKIKNIIMEYSKVQKLTGVAISTAGVIDYTDGSIKFALAIPNYTGTKLKETIEEDFKLKCAVENDVNCIALGEMWLGAGKGKSSLFCMALGTSIGGCAVFDKKVIHGASNSAGEIAYMLIPGGNMHELVSTTRLVKDVANAKNITVDEVNGKKIFAWAKQDDEISKNAIYRLMEHLADGIVNITSVFNPEMIILGGGIMAQTEYLQPIITQILKEKLQPNVYEKTEIAFAKLENDAGMLGALYNLLYC